ncbi:MAG: hypothetical protein RL077_3918 [Verrucomicrobiota bacterium]|jgi:hypothetical protein
MKPATRSAPATRAVARVGRGQISAPPLATDRCEHRFKHGQRTPRLIAEWRDPAVTGIETRILMMLHPQRIVGSIVSSDAVPEFTASRGAPETLNPTVLVGWRGRRGKLSANPVGLFRQDSASNGSGDGADRSSKVTLDGFRRDSASTGSGVRKRGSDATGSNSGDGDVAVE